jgi:hypothetical protein
VSARTPAPRAPRRPDPHAPDPHAPDPHALDRARLRVAAGIDPGDLTGLPDGAATTVRVATTVGAPLLAALDAAAASAEDRRRSERAVAVASAQGRAVSVGLLAAPLLLVPAMGRLFGVDLVAYHRTPVGTATGALGLGLLLLGAWLAWIAVDRIGRPPRPTAPARRPLRSVAAATAAALLFHPLVGVAVGAIVWWRSPPAAPTAVPQVADAADLTAVAVGGGLSTPAALRVAADELPALALPLRRLAFDLELGHLPTGAPPGVDRLADVLTTAAAVGAPVGPTLRRLASDVRADELARVLAAAERLPVQLTFPTALCLLPGVLLLIGAPIVRTALDAAGT